MLPFPFDIHSLVFVLIAVAVIECLAMAFIWSTRKTYPGFGHWTIGNATFAAAFFLILLRGIIPDVLTVLVANILIMIASVLYYEGVLRFRNLAGRKATSIVLILLMAVFIFYFRFVENLIGVRIIAASFLLAVINGLVAWSLLYHTPSSQRTSHWLTGSIFAAHSAFNLFRGVATLLIPGSHDLFSPYLLQAATFLLPLLLSIPWTFGFLILNSERLETELNLEITERKTVEEALKGSEEKYRQLVETMPLAIFVEIEGKITYVNPAFIVLFKASSSAEVIGTRLVELIPPDLYDVIEERRRIMSDTQRALPPIELKLRCMDGTFITVLSTPMPIIFQGRRAILSTLYDITERKRIETELKKAQKLLQLYADELKYLHDKQADN